MIEDNNNRKGISFVELQLREKVKNLEHENRRLNIIIESLRLELRNREFR